MLNFDSGYSLDPRLAESLRVPEISYSDKKVPETVLMDCLDLRTFQMLRTDESKRANLSDVLSLLEGANRMSSALICA